jgi:hypothetical protein
LVLILPIGLSGIRLSGMLQDDDLFVVPNADILDAGMDILNGEMVDFYFQ